jgi:choline dehydrogenase-like flavoprotein
MAHPGLAVGAVFERDVRMWAGATQSWESGHFWDRRFKLESLGLPAAMVAARLPGFGGELARALDELPRTALWAIQCRARAEGTVRPSPFSRAPWVRYDLGDEDVATFAEAVDVVGRMMFAAGGKELILGIHGMPERVRTEAELARVREVFRDPRQAHFIATHLFGGARMGPDARRHPVDLRFALRGLERCYVVDSSVFPSNLGVNPQHTILATARIAASRML